MEEEDMVEGSGEYLQMPNDDEELLGGRSDTLTTVNDIMGNATEGTLAIHIWEADDLKAVNRLMGGADAFVLVGYWKRQGMHNLNKREAPSPRIGKTAIKYSTTKPRWDQEIALKFSRRLMSECAGVHMQVLGFKNLGGDAFLGEVVLNWEDVAEACQKGYEEENAVTTFLTPRTWAKSVAKDDKTVQGSITYSMCFIKATKN